MNCTWIVVIPEVIPASSSIAQAETKIKVKTGKLVAVTVATD